MKIRMVSDEWYPVYEAFEGEGSCDVQVEVAPETLARWKAAQEAFIKAQEEMAAVYRAAIKVRRSRRGGEG